MAHHLQVDQAEEEDQETAEHQQRDRQHARAEAVQVGFDVAQFGHGGRAWLTGVGWRRGPAHGAAAAITDCP